jgi:TorA maturation chaperone TorD
VKGATENLSHTEGIQFEELENLTEAATSGNHELIISEYEGLTSPQKNFFYECNYHAPSNAMEEMADIAGFYKAFHVGSESERPDYISIELEFMSLLTLKEAKALMNNKAPGAEICLSTQKKFLDSHLGRWVKTLSQVTNELIYYGILCRLLNKWIDAECRHLSVSPDKNCFFSNSTFFENQTGPCLKEER